ncbi:MAG: tetratricopeptide repeat protein [Verrucomicrobia bacterium]|nr:tetratricopeptide repeat protein [Verrucomicrobiota bacterium]
MPAALEWILYGLLGVAILLLWFKRSRDAPLVLILKWLLSAGLIFGMVRIGMALHNGRESAIMGMIVIWALALVLAILWTPNITAWFANPVGALFDGGDIAAEPVPLYSIALARRAAGKYREAVWEIQKQLGKFPNDFMGQMLLATIQAENLQDLPSAQNTIERLLAQPVHPPLKIAAALTHLADWHLQLGDNPAAARAAFERILARLPGTEQAQLATQRLAHLEDYRSTKNFRQRGTIALPHGETDVGLKISAATKPEETPEAAAARLVQQLQLHPADWEAREQLATIYATHYRRPELALGELEQLIAEPQAPAKHVARWLNRVADLHLERHDPAAARVTLQRLADNFPNTASAELARNRLATLETSVRAHEKRDGGVALGNYERDLGLKGRLASDE